MHFLLTRHGGLLHYDVQRQAFRHGDVQRAPLNVVVGQAGLPSDAAERDAFVINGPRAAAVWGAPVACRALPDGRVILPCGDDALLATGDGGLARGPASADGCFWLLSRAQLADLRLILRNRWVSDTTSDEEVLPCSARLVGRALHLGALSFELGAIVAGLGDAASRKAFVARDDGWKINRFRLFRPLAYYAAFGKDAVFDCLCASLASLLEFGGWEDDVLLMTDAGHAHAKWADGATGSVPLHVRTMQCRDTLDYTLARYRIASLPDFADYQPIVYIDTDVVIDAPLGPLMTQLVRSAAIHFCPENVLLDTRDDWYGRSLLLNDLYRPVPFERGFSTGLIGFRDVGDVAELFAHLIATTTAYVEQSGDRNAFCTFDQAFANYVLRKLGGFETALLDRYCAIYQPGQVADASRPRGFAHFVGGVGNAAPKLRRMVAYQNALRAAGAGRIAATGREPRHLREGMP